MTTPTPTLTPSLTRLGLSLACLLLPGCVSLNVDTAPIASALPGLTAQLAAHNAQAAAGLAGTTGPTGSCPNGATPAAGTTLGTTFLGGYADVVLPASFSVYQDEQAVTDRITRFSQDTSPAGRNTWTDFQCLFPEAMAVWDAKRGQGTAAGVGQAEGTSIALPPDPGPAYATPAPAAPVTADCAADIDPAAGTITGSAELGAYAGAVLPASFAVYTSEEEITDRISGFAYDDSSTGISTWAAFQCFYGQAVATWRAAEG